MAAVPPSGTKLQPAHMERIWKLRHVENRTLDSTRRALAQGWPDADPPVPPVNVTHQTISHAHKRLLRERDDLYSTKVQQLPSGEAMDVLARRMLMIADRETIRLGEKQIRGSFSKVDAAKLGALAAAVEKIHKLLTLRATDPNPGAGVPGPAPQKGSEPEPSTLAASLLADQDGDQSAPGPVADAPVPDPSLPPHRREPIPGQTTVDDQLADVST